MYINNIINNAFDDLASPRSSWLGGIGRCVTAMHYSAI